MTDWHALRQQGYAVPEDAAMPALLDELTVLLASPDPVERDEIGYSFVATWLGRGVVEHRLRLDLGDEMVRRFGAGDVWTRTFAPLVLDALVTYGTFEPRWVEPFRQWYATEADLRGHDPELGWLHAVAHGADLLGTLGHHPDVAPADMLALAASRLCAPSDLLWGEGEDERLGHAIALTLTHPGLGESEALRWIDEVERCWAACEPGPAPAWVSNGARTLRVVALLTLTGARSERLPTTPVRHAEPVRTRLLAALHTLTPHQW